MKKKSNIKHNTRQSAWQLKWAAARRNLAWAWDRVQWMALGAALMWAAQMIWR